MRFASGPPGVALDHQFLDRDRAFDGGDDGGKLQQKPIARRLDDTAAVVSDDRTRCLPMLAHRSRCPRLVLTHQARVADDIDGEGHGKAADVGHCSGSPALRRLSTTAGVFELRADMNLTVSLGLSLSASATADFASSMRFVIA